MPNLVLIVDDSASCAETLEVALESLPGVELRMVRSAQAALAACHDARNQIAAILTDLHLSGGSGFDLIVELRAAAEFSRVPILLISGDSDPQLPDRARGAGADAFIAKPYSPSAVRRKVEELICSRNSLSSV